jgi:hypothetical protein
MDHSEATCSVEASVKHINVHAADSELVYSRRNVGLAEMFRHSIPELADYFRLLPLSSNDRRVQRAAIFPIGFLPMRLSDFIRTHSEEIAKEWETFARTCEERGANTGVRILRGDSPGYFRRGHAHRSSTALER